LGSEVSDIQGKWQGGQQMKELRRKGGPEEDGTAAWHRVK
jgi:hypothetical protein